jgi:hypothetical protein
MIPGHPAGQWQYDPEPDAKLPSPSELRDIFDEQAHLSELSADSWLALRRLAFSLDGEPVQYGPLVCRPNDDEFDPEMLRDEWPESRVDALESGHAKPTLQELERWREVHMERARLDEAPGFFAAQGWVIKDDTGRERILVTLHGDRGTFERVARLFQSVDDAAKQLSTYGEFEWLW